MTKRKHIARFLTLLLAVSCVFWGMAMTSFADDYEYQVTMSAGSKGSVEGTATQNFAYGDTFDPDSVDVKVDGKKYYFKGWHMAGQEAIVHGDVEITKDVDFVASYGMKSNMTSYTVKYVDENGKELADPATFYGSVGDKPVLSFPYFEGYVPKAKYLTMTLKEDASENVLTFEYTKNDSGTVEEPENPDEDDNDNEGDDNGGDNGDQGDNGGQNGGNGDQGGADGTADDGNGQNADADDDGTTIEDEDSPTAETIDLDDEDSPTAESQTEEDADNGGGMNPVALGIGGVCALGLIGLAIAIIRRRTE